MNRLQNETSPYLLQHAANPVDWYPWGEEALNAAAGENKLLIISIGYAACHWCHVMERECFENPEAARFMNENFISIKVDREERPDIDQIYMEAVQMLTGSGGWPLNIIALPDGRPIYGGTYFPLHNWMSLLDQILQYAMEKGDKIREQSEALVLALQSSIQNEEPVNMEAFTGDYTEKVFRKMIHLQDALEGGSLGSPKFPMPSSLRFMAEYSYSSGDEEGENQVFLTLDKMAHGGIYDQVGGGFARYSIDSKWKVPHFEKMLYDNGQLMSLYSNAFRRTGRKKYRDIVYETASFLAREMTSPEGPFYSSLDADSEGVEGRYYTWTSGELDRILENRSAEIKKYYSVTDSGNWEEGRNILHIDTAQDVPGHLADIKNILLGEREKRIRPALDNKILASWNGLMILGYADAYKAFNHKPFLDAALKAAVFIAENLMDEGLLYRTLRSGRPYIPGFLDDYAFTAAAFLSLYELIFDSLWLERAEQLVNYVLSHFNDSDSPLFFYKSDRDRPLIARKKEILDNVIPSSNSQMGENLYRMGLILHRQEYTDRATAMAKVLRSRAEKGTIHFANWNRLINAMIDKPYIATISGPDRDALRKTLQSGYMPGLICIPGHGEADEIMLCRDNYCLKPVQSAEEALSILTAQIL
ncbi:MAG: thioredoxin domain-containing protein [Spirochaetales bacterium]|nr:thioredoxin domain-containing protein [Spirochaetales bacterium]